MSSGFVTEAELEAKKKARQEEWERVRKPEDPATAPEEPVDNRSLFDRLEENRVTKQEAWEEEHKLKNQIRGINGDEADFLDQVNAIRSAQEKERSREEAKALDEYREKQSKLLDETEKLKRKHVLGSFKQAFAKKSGQCAAKSPLAGVVKSPAFSDHSPAKKLKTVDGEGEGSSGPKEEGAKGLAGLLGDYSSSGESDEDQ